MATTLGDLLLIFLPQVDLGSLHLVCAVATQGNPGGNRDYVKRYKLQCSSDGVTWTVYEENGNTVSKSIRAFAKFTLCTCRTTEGCATSFPGPLPSLWTGKVLETRLRHVRTVFQLQLTNEKGLVLCFSIYNGLPAVHGKLELSFDVY